MFLKVHNLFILPMFLEIEIYSWYLKLYLNIDVITDLMHKSIPTYEKHADGFI